MGWRNNEIESSQSAQTGFEWARAARSDEMREIEAEISLGVRRVA